MESFSFQQSKRLKLATSNPTLNLKTVEDEILTQDAHQLEEYDDPLARYFSAAEANTFEYDLNQQLYMKFPTAVRTNGTLYQVFTCALLNALVVHSLKTRRMRLTEFKTMLYFGQLGDLGAGMKGVPAQYERLLDRNGLEAKIVLIKGFRLIEKEVEQHHMVEEESCLLRVLTRYPVILFAFSVALRKLVLKLSELYEMDIEPQSIYNLQTQPQVDILWLLCEFFDVNVTLYQLDGNILRQEKFKINQTVPICLVHNNSLSDVRWTYLHLREARIKQISLIQECEGTHHVQEGGNEHLFYNTNSSASQLRLITGFDKDTQRQADEVMCGPQLTLVNEGTKTPSKYSSNKEGANAKVVVSTVKKSGQLSISKQSKKKKLQEIRREFDNDFDMIQEKSRNILEKGQMVLKRFDNLVSESDKKLLEEERSSLRFVTGFSLHQ